MNTLPLAKLMGLWPFAQAALLWWGAAATVPLVIHLLSRRRYRDSSWAAMQFLLAAVKKHARRMRIEQLLLLLARMALLILLALALAEPLLNSQATPSGSALATQTHWVFVVDVSYSMAYKPAEKPLFELAQEAAREVIQAAGQGDGFTLIAMGVPAQAVIRDPAFDRADVLRELDRLVPRHAGANLRSALEETKSIVEQAKRRHPRLTVTRVCVFTDLGQTTWEEVETSTTRKLVGDLARDARLHLFELGDPVWNNAAITRLELVEPLVTPGRDARFVAEIRRLSSDLPRQTRAVAVVDGQVVHEVNVDLTSGSETLAFAHRFATTGYHSVELKMAGADPLDVDNHRWLAVHVRESLKTLCVEGNPGAARFVATAIAPQETAESRMGYEVVSQAGLMEKDLSDYECVFLCNVPFFRPEETEVLRRYVRSGGGLVVFLGDQVQLENYNQQFHNEDASQRLLPAKLSDLVADGVHYFNPLEYRHPLVRPFQSHERAGLLTVPIQRYVRLDVGDDIGTRVALALDNGNPILVEHYFGRGRVFLFGSSVSPNTTSNSNSRDAWTEFPVWPSFPPIIQELTTLSLARRDNHLGTTVGEMLTGEGDGRSGVPRILIRDPRDETDWVEVQSAEVNPDLPAWIYGPTVWSGLYRASIGADAPAYQIFSVNVDVAEGVLDRLEPDSLPSQFERGISSGDIQPTESGPTQRRSLARPLLAAVFGLLLLESYLAWCFGSARL